MHWVVVGAIYRSRAPTMSTLLRRNCFCFKRFAHTPARYQQLCFLCRSTNMEKDAQAEPIGDDAWKWTQRGIHRFMKRNREAYRTWNSPNAGDVVPLEFRRRLHRREWQRLIKFGDIIAPERTMEDRMYGKRTIIVKRKPDGRWFELVTASATNIRVQMRRLSVS